MPEHTAICFRDWARIALTPARRADLCQPQPSEGFLTSGIKIFACSGDSDQFGDLEN